MKTTLDLKEQAIPGVTEAIQRFLPEATEAKNWWDWKWQLRHSFQDPYDICRVLSFPRPEDNLRAVMDEFVVRVTPYYLNLLCRALATHGHDHVERVSRTFLPNTNEVLGAGIREEDGMGEEGTHPKRVVSKLYPDRALLFVTNVCPMYCRYCFRKRKVGRIGEPGVPSSEIEAAIDDIARDEAVRDVILSGGEPLMLSDDSLMRFIKRIARIDHVGIIRIDTKFLAVAPHRFSGTFADRLAAACGDKVLHLTFHFVHPLEVTDDVKHVTRDIAARGIIMNAYIPLLKGVNDDRQILKDLFWALACAKVRPYYLVQNVTNRWNFHFQVPIERGRELVEGLSGEISGLALPQYIAYLPKGGGKALLNP